MSLVKCCFGQHESLQQQARPVGEPWDTTAKLKDKSQPPSAINVAQADVDASNKVEQKTKPARLSSSSSACPTFDLKYLYEVQTALNALEGDSFEVRAPQVVSCAQEHLGPDTLVRLFGLTSSGSDPATTRYHLVQLATSFAPSMARPVWSDDRLPGRSFTLARFGGPAEQSAPDSLPGEAVSSSLLAGLVGLLGGSAAVQAPLPPQQPPLLMELALTSKAPAVYQIERAAGKPEGPSQDGSLYLGTAFPTAGGPDAAASRSFTAAPPPHPRDCLTELAALPGASLLTFAALPLSVGRRQVGVLWVVMRQLDDPHDPSYGPSQDNCAGAAGEVAPEAPAAAAPTLSPATREGRTHRGLALLLNRAVLSQLALSVSMALAAALPNPDYVSWLAGTIRRLASCGNLHTLVAGVCTAMARHVQWRFHTDVAVQSALVPEPDSPVAFMLYPETKAQGGGPGASALEPSALGSWAGDGPVAGPGNAAGAYEGSEAQPRPRSGVLATFGRHELRRVSSQAVLLQQCPAGDAGPDAPRLRGAFASPQQRPLRAAHDGVSTGATARIGRAPATGSGTGMGTIGAGTEGQPSPSALRDRARNRERERAADVAAVPDRTPSATARNFKPYASGGAGMASAPAMLFSLSAKAFQTSHTLLLRLIARSHGSFRDKERPGSYPAGRGDGGSTTSAASLTIPHGIIVPDTARHVADVRQPSRDVCMLLGSKNSMTAASAAAWQLAEAFGSGGGGGGGREQSSGRKGAASLVLMALEVAEGGCLLGLYIAFPTPMPSPLLAAVRDSCGHFIKQVLVDLVPFKLCTPELSPDFATLRAGVPGSYMSVSRVREAVNRLQLPAAASARTQSFVAPKASYNTCTKGMAGSWSRGPCGGGNAEDAAPDDVIRAAGRHGPMGLMVDSLVADGCSTGQQVWGDSRQGSSAQARDVEAVGPDYKRKGLSAYQPSIARRLFGLTLAGSSSLVCRPSAADSVGASTASGIPLAATVPEGAGCMAGNSGQLILATGGLSSGLHPNGGGVPSGVTSKLILESVPDAGTEPRFGLPAAMVTVHDLDEAWGMRGIMGALVDSIMTTLRASVAELPQGINSNDLPARATEGLEDLHLIEVLGHGASGVVLRGLLGTVPVAVKLMEMPDVDQEQPSGAYSLMAPNASGAPNRQYLTNQADQPTPDAVVRSLASMLEAIQYTPPRGSGTAHAVPTSAPGTDEPLPDTGAAGPGDGGAGGGGGCGFGAGLPHPTESIQVRARRTMMRNATELAVMRTVSHVNIVQAFAVYDNVIMERTADDLNGFHLRRLDAKNPETGGSPICTAIVQELCDCGSLADVLSARTFPTLVPVGPGAASLSIRTALHGDLTHPGSGRHGGLQGCVWPGGAGTSDAAGRRGGGASRMEVDLRGVYLTLLEIALALRHLHARRLVHRDLKPANILLKSSPSDPRGWTCKLADFGFALVLDQQDSSLDSSRDCSEAAAAPLLAGLPGRLPGSGSAGSAPRGWCTIQAQACGTVTYMAPEAMVKHSRIDASVDIFSFGVICWELVCGRGHRPLRNLEPDDIPDAVRAGARPVFPTDVPPAYRKLATACWAQDPQRRPRAADVVSYIKGQLSQLQEHHR